MSQSKLEYSYIVWGNMYHFRSAADLIGTELEVLFDEEWIPENQQITENPVLKMDGSPTACDDSLTRFIFGIVTFAGAWAAKKVLDEFYENKLKPAIISFYQKMNSDTLQIDNSQFEYWNITWFKDLNVAILVRTIAHSAQDIENQSDLIFQTHKIGTAWLIENGKQAPIHEYRIENGQVNISPNFYSSVEQLRDKTKIKKTLNISELKT